MFFWHWLIRFFFFHNLLQGLWPSLSVGEQLHREAQLPLLLSVSVVTDSSHDWRLHLWPHIRPAPHGWIMEAALHCHVSLHTLNIVYVFASICDFIRVIVYLMRLLQSSFPYEFFQFGSDQYIRAVSYPCPGSHWIPPVLSVQRAHHKWTGQFDFLNVTLLPRAVRWFLSTKSICGALQWCFNVLSDISENISKWLHFISSWSHR